MTPIEQQIESIVDNILLDYCHGRDIDKMDLFQHPDKAVIIDMIGKLMRIIYPGSARDKTYRIYNARHNLSMLIEDVMYNLNKQITVVLKTQMPEEEAAAQAQQLSLCISYGIAFVHVFQHAVHAAFYADVQLVDAKLAKHPKFRIRLLLDVADRSVHGDGPNLRQLFTDHLRHARQLLGRQSKGVSVHQKHPPGIQFHL